MDLEDAIQPHPEGITLRFEVVPGSSKLSVPSGFNPWRKSLEARLTEAPMGGRANRQLVEALSELFSVPKGNVEVLSGHKNARKVILVRGIDIDRAIAILKDR
jgi:uncharacterized protein